jgi:hypothetical protein
MCGRPRNPAVKEVLVSATETFVSTRWLAQAGEGGPLGREPPEFALFLSLSDPHQDFDGEGQDSA